MHTRSKFYFILFCLFFVASPNFAQTLVFHCEHEPSNETPCGLADVRETIPLLPMNNGVRPPKELFYILASDTSITAKEVSFKLYEIRDPDSEETYLDRSLVMPEAPFNFCWVKFSYFRTGIFVLRTYVDDRFIGEDKIIVTEP